MSVETAKAIVLAGDCRGPEPWPGLGLGARQLAPVANKPILFHHLEALGSAGVREVAVITDVLTNASIRDAVGDGSGWGLDVRYVEHDGRDDPLASPELAGFLDGAPLLIQHGDVLLRERTATVWEEFCAGGLDALVLRLAPRSGIAGPVPTATAYVIGRNVQDALRGEAGSDPPRGLDDVLGRLRRSGARIRSRDVEACMPCRGRAEVLLEANRWMLEHVEPGQLGERVIRSELQGLVALHPSAEVRDSLIRGPVSIAAGALISNAYVGPYTSIAAGVRIDGVEIEHSIVLGGAQIGFVGVRMQDCVIGVRAHVGRDFRLPQAMSLAIGEAAAVSLG